MLFVEIYILYVTFKKTDHEISENQPADGNT